jgi:hypothetical protein
MSNENIIFKDSIQQDIVDKHGFIIKKPKQGINYGKEPYQIIIDVDIIEECINIKLSEEDRLIAKEIKNKLRKTAETIVDIGEALTNAIKGKKKGFKEIFYEEIGISSRSAQRYMKIANHPMVLQLKKENQLEGKTMTDLEKLISSSKYKKEKYNLDIKKVAKSLFTRYKTKPEELKEIVNELNYLLNQHLYKLQTNNI